MSLAQIQYTERKNFDALVADESEMLRFLSDVQSTFRRERHGIVGPWQYSSSHHAGDLVQGSLLWEAFLRASDNDYYPLENETQLIKVKAQHLVKDVSSPVLLVDFGPGPTQAVENKSIPIKRLFKDVVGYVSIDACDDYVRDSCRVIAKENPHIPLYGYQADYMADNINIPKTAKALGLFFGGTIANIEGHPDQGLPAEKIVTFLRHLKHILGNDGSLLITNDTNQDEESILSSYNHPLQKSFGANVMHRIKRDLPVYGNFDPDMWRYKPVWYAESHQLCHTIICERDQEFLLGNERFRIKKGESFILNNSFKYPVEKMKEWAHEAGFSTHRHVMDHQNRQALHLMAA